MNLWRLLTSDRSGAPDLGDQTHERHTHVASSCHDQCRDGVVPALTGPTVDVPPSASRLVNSLRNIGYSFPSAVADLVDNSISAGAQQIDIELVFAGDRSYVVIADDGTGMTNSGLVEALRFGTRRGYEDGELGSFGLGLKTASLSQCRRVSVVTRRAPLRRRLYTRTLDLDHILATDRWEITDIPRDSSAGRALDWLNHDPGTVVLWEHLDRVLPDHNPSGGWARRRLESLRQRTSEHLGMVFHRFIEGTATGRDRIVVTVNGKKVRGWNPFGPKEELCEVLAPRQVDIAGVSGRGTVHLAPYVLPAKSQFSSLDEWERLSGPEKWNRQQGLYIYRSDRMIQSGGWCGLRSADEHTKLARAALDFPTALDELFGINVAKMRVALPAEVKGLLTDPIAALCHRAQARYRHETAGDAGHNQPPVPSNQARHVDATALGAAILSAAFAAERIDALVDVIDRLRSTDPDAATALGWS